MELTELGNLRSLNIYDNPEITGEIPAGLAEIDTLNSLWLGGALTGSIPAGIWEMPNLTRLAIRDAPAIEIAIPAAGSALTNLQVLYLNGTTIDGPVPEAILDMPALETLGLQRTGLTGTLPAEIGNLTNLNSLYLSDNGLDGPIPAELGQLLELTILDLSDNLFSGPVPTEIGNLENLGSLYLSNNRLSGMLPASLADLSNVRFLRLNGNDCFEADAATRAWVTALGQEQALVGVGRCAAPEGVSAFTALAPVRLFDTRSDAAPSGKIRSGGTLDVQVAGRLGVPADATAVVLNVTGTQASSSGYVTVFPSGTERPLASFVEPGDRPDGSEHGDCAAGQQWQGEFLLLGWYAPAG